MSDVEQIEHDATMCNLCCPHGITPAEAQLEYEHANILRMQRDTEQSFPSFTPYVMTRTTPVEAGPWSIV